MNQSLLDRNLPSPHFGDVAVSVRRSIIRAFLVLGLHPCHRNKARNGSVKVCCPKYVNLTWCRVGYVPEHFLTPVLLADKHNLFPEKVALHPCPSGTGQMLERLKNKEIGSSLPLCAHW
jgi:hypothetical protein